LIAVILAAGSGTRLRPLTDRTPKCLLEVAGRTILDRLLDALVTAGLDRSVIVTGHHSEVIEAHLGARVRSLEVTCIRNSAYATTNNAASLAVARGAIGSSDFVLCDADVVFSVSPIPSLLAEPAQCALAVDLSVPWSAEAMKVQVDADGTVRRVSKRLSAGSSAGESIGIQKIGGTAAPMLWDVLVPLLASDAATAYYEDAFQRLIDRGVRFGFSPVAPGSWMEIDDAADLDAARERFRT
jgi:choline kinase